MSDESTAMAACPASAELEAFAAGNLPRRSFERIARHVESCSGCDAVLSQLDDRVHRDLSGLRQIAPEDLAIESPLPPDLVAAASRAAAERGPATEVSEPAWQIRVARRTRDRLIRPGLPRSGYRTQSHRGAEALACRAAG